MKLILEAIKALFRKVWFKLTALENAVEAVTPLVVRMTIDGMTYKLDKTFNEIVEKFQKDEPVTLIVNGQTDSQIGFNGDQFAAIRLTKDGNSYVVEFNVNRIVDDCIHSNTINLTNYYANILWSSYKMGESTSSVYYAMVFPKQE